MIVFSPTKTLVVIGAKLNGFSRRVILATVSKPQTVPPSITEVTERSSINVIESLHPQVRARRFDDISLFQAFCKGFSL